MAEQTISAEASEGERQRSEPGRQAVAVAARKTISV